MKSISIVAPTYNEEENVIELLDRVRAVITEFPLYLWSIIIIDNASTDNTRSILEQQASVDSRIKLIFNTRNFGHIRSPYFGILSSDADATIYLASDLQDPPELIPEFIKEWENGYKLVMATKPVSKENKFLHEMRKTYYDLLDGISDVSIVKDSTGFGLYDQVVIAQLREIGDPYPFLRGLICELGYSIKTIPFNQPRRLRGLSKNNFYTLYDIAMLGLISHSKLPLRLSSFIGFAVGSLSILYGLYYFVNKIINWDSIDAGVGPAVIGIYILMGLVFIFIGLLGEYLGSIHTYLQNRPVVVVDKKINFDQ